MAGPGLLDKLITKIESLGSQGQSAAQTNAAAQNLQTLATKFGGTDTQCTASRPELKAIADNGGKPIMEGGEQLPNEYRSDWV